MYSNKINVNILTNLLLQHGIHHAVVCPGSRNSPIVHNLNECEDIQCYPVTDERSAGFFALGIAQTKNEPVVVCVTSGSALLNVAPAVAEAYYQHLPLIVISADRPQQWIGQLDGQTMVQPNALQNFVRKTVTLPEPHDEQERWHCNRLVNEALLEVEHRGKGPVHINVPITEPLYEYTVEQIPQERKITLEDSQSPCLSNRFKESLQNATRPLIVIGQVNPLTEIQLEDRKITIAKLIDALKEKFTILYGPLSGYNAPILDLLLESDEIGSLNPDLIVYLGGTLVSKKVKAYLRTVECENIWMVNPEGRVEDVTMRATHILETSAENFLQALYQMDLQIDNTGYHTAWKSLINKVSFGIEEYEPAYSEMAVVKYFAEQLEDMDYDYQVHYANSSAVRLANFYAYNPVFCNRGINGIEGCISTAAGMSAATSDIVFCITGDLAFFYDQNALWNKNLKGNLRIIILNNGEGSIFERFDGLKQSEAKDMVVGTHKSKADGICAQNDCGYLKATNLQEMQLGIVQLMTMDTNRPIVLEVFTDAQTDDKVLREIHSI